MQNLTSINYNCEGSNLTIACITYNFWSWKFSQRGRRRTKKHSQLKSHQWQPFLGSFCHEDMVLLGFIFDGFHLASNSWNLAIHYQDILGWRYPKPENSCAKTQHCPIVDECKTQDSNGYVTNCARDSIMPSNAMAGQVIIASPSCQCAHSSWLHFSRRVHRVYISGDQRAHTAGSFRISSI